MTNIHLRAGLFIFSILVCVAFSSPVFAGNVIVIDADSQFAFAEHTFSKAEYRRAVAEYERFLHFFPNDDRGEKARYQIGIACFRGKQYSNAITGFNELIDRYGFSRLGIESWFMLSECHKMTNNPLQAITTLQNLIILTEDIIVADKANYKIGWCYIEMADFGRAARHFDKISTQNRSDYRIDELSEMLENEPLIKMKNPGLAGTLSILPGAGQLYCERYQDALIAFLLNTGLILAAYESFDNDMVALGAVISLVEVGFYAGNIYGAVGSAHKYNRKTTNNYIDYLKENTKIDLTAAPAEKGLILSFKINY
ncbi:MAG: tetratricopeptide repeat protein [Desulfobacterales bacterium]|nr:tetratricopeptide repeat protein [Desulfobacterales bacterium]